MKKKMKITLGIKGKKCLKYAELLEKLADAKVEKQEFTSEYYEQEVEEISQQENLYE